MSFWERIEKEWPLIKAAPISICGLMFAAAAVGYLVAMWYYAKRVEDAEGRAKRYERAAGVSDPSRGGLVDLTNSELKARAYRLSSQMNARYSQYQATEGRLLSEFQNGRITKEKMDEQDQIAQNKLLFDFNDRMRSEAGMINNELRDRIDPEVRKHIPMAAPELNSSLWTIVPQNSYSLVMFMGVMAKEMEDLANALPDD